MASKKVTISLVALLLLSLAGNLFFAGLVAGRALSPDKRIERFMERDRELRARIPDEDRQKLRKMMQENLPQMKQAKSGFDEARRAVHRAISADPLDEAALREAVDNMLSVQNDMHKALADSVVEAAPDLSPEGRKAMVQHILFRHEAKDRRKGAMREMIKRKMMERRQQGLQRDGGQERRMPPDMDYPPPPPQDMDMDARQPLMPPEPQD